MYLFRFHFLLQLTFKCSGSSHPPPSTVESHVDPHTGVHLQEVTATISKDLVFEYFGKTPFKCDCHAWSPRGKAKSQSATIEVACKYIHLFLLIHSPQQFIALAYLFRECIHAFAVDLVPFKITLYSSAFFDVKSHRERDTAEYKRGRENKNNK